jgi:hypothetical protein
MEPIAMIDDSGIRVVEGYVSESLDDVHDAEPDKRGIQEHGEVSQNACPSTETLSWSWRARRRRCGG